MLYCCYLTLTHVNSCQGVHVCTCLLLANQWWTSQHHKSASALKSFPHLEHALDHPHQDWGYKIYTIAHQLQYCIQCNWLNKILLINLGLTRIFSVSFFMRTTAIFLSKVRHFTKAGVICAWGTEKALSSVIWHYSFFMVSIALPLPSCMAINQASSRQAFAAEPCALITMSGISLAWWRENQIQLACPARNMEANIWHAVQRTSWQNGL